MNTLKTGLICLAMTVLLTGCFGGGAEVKTTTTTVSVGQQLIDLKNAYDNGAMTQQQYQKAKQQLIEKTLDN